MARTFGNCPSPGVRIPMINKTEMFYFSTPFKNMQEAYIQLRHITNREMAGEIIRWLDRIHREDEREASRENWEEIGDRKAAKFKWGYGLIKGIRDVLDNEGIEENICINCLRVFDLKLHICDIDFKIQNPISFKSMRVEEIADLFREKFSYILDQRMNGDWDGNELSCLLGEKERCKKFNRWDHLKGEIHYEQIEEREPRRQSSMIRLKPMRRSHSWYV